jgi:uncharacterized damage-inducible protein DinB
MLNHLRELMGHAAWADAVFIHAWGKSPARDHEQVRRRVDHLVGVQAAFLSLFRGDPPGGPPDGPPPLFDALKARVRTTHADLQTYVHSLGAEALSRNLRIPWFPDPPCVITVADALVQVAMHTQHHRGQCMTRLKDFGGEPKNVDWIIWLWKGKPVARWD